MILYVATFLEHAGYCVEEQAPWSAVPPPWEGNSQVARYIACRFQLSDIFSKHIDGYRAAVNYCQTARAIQQDTRRHSQGSLPV